MLCVHVEKGTCYIIIPGAVCSQHTHLAYGFIDDNIFDNGQWNKITRVESKSVLFTNLNAN